MSDQAFPLKWPAGWKRTPPYSREDRRVFRATFEQGRRTLFREIEMLGGSGIVLSTNLPLRNDGFPYASAREPEDPGVAVYFTYQKKPMCFACDQYRYVRQNIRAIALTIDALRGIKRWSASDMMERAFTGFVAIEDKFTRPWREILEIGPTETGDRAAMAERVQFQFRLLSKTRHPDAGGSEQAFLELTAACDRALKELM